MVDLLNAAMKDEMDRDPRIVVFGEDVADASREGVLDEVKGKGGVFKVTANLQRRFGGIRVFNSPLAEANIVGRAATLREGSDLTLITYGATVQRSLAAAKELADKEGIETEILDLRTLSPFDWDAIAASVRRTSKALVVYEDPISWGFGAEIAARIADDLFEWLDAPVRRVAALDSQVGYAPALEDAILPQVEDIRAGIRELARY
jgi:pyruvate/2-oxoglutarate/acetoin dehydrogenase E1 component